MKCTTVAAAVGVVALAAFTVAAQNADAHAAEPVCQASRDNAPQSVGLHVVTLTGIDCAQQVDALKYVAQLQHQAEGQTRWVTDDQYENEATLPLHRRYPLNGKCVPGRWRVMTEIWERVAGQTHHGLYSSDEVLMNKWDCLEKEEM